MGIFITMQDYESTLKQTSLTNNNKALINDEKMLVYDFDKIKENILRQLGIENACKSCDALMIKDNTNILFEFKNQSYINLKKNEAGEDTMYQNGKTRCNDLKIKAFDSKALLNLLRNSKIIQSERDILYVVYRNGKDKRANRFLESSTIEEINPKIVNRFQMIGRKNIPKDEFIAFGLYQLKGKIYEEIHTYNKKEFESFFLESNKKQDSKYNDKEEKQMKAIDIRNKYLNFFKTHGHKVIPSAPLIPENDPSVLFTTAGMQPLVPYLLGEKHPEGNRLTDFQKCLRTNDIDEVGDNRHLTYFEMLGNWSLGDYFKEEAVAMSFEFLTKELGIPAEKLSVTCFAGDEDAPRDTVTAECWKKVGIPEERIYFYGKDNNWWIAGEEGPCGPDTEMFYDTGKEVCGPDCQPSCDCGKYVEIWNNVFMEYYKSKEGGYTKLKQQNVDTGLGLERMTMLLQGKNTPFETELFAPVMEKLEELSKIDSIESKRIVAEHLRASIMVIADGGRPSNIDRGYVLRKLIRRMARHLNKLQIDLERLPALIDLNIDTLKEMYPELVSKKEEIKQVIVEEKDKFMKTLSNGEKEFEKAIQRAKQEGKTEICGQTMFKLYETYGFPPEITADLAAEAGFKIDTSEFEKLFKEHQEKSRMGSEQKFKGGLAEQNEITTAYHTATHLLNAALRKIVGKDVHQKGSNITVERMRFDFSCDHKLSDEEKQKVEDLVNEWIKQEIPVTVEEMKKEDAIKSGAECMFIEKYPDTVTVYSIGDFSKELCGGPHVKNTKELGTFKIKKEEASSAGVRRIKAVLIK